MASWKEKNREKAEGRAKAPSPQLNTSYILTVPPEDRRKHTPTATEKYYLQIISTMKGEMESLFKVVRSKEQDVERLRSEKMDLKAENRHLRSLLSTRDPQQSDFPHPLSRSTQFPSTKSFHKK